MNKEVSVVIPVYNGEKFIERAVNSVLGQSIKPSEIIVVNDGSIDATAEKLASFGKEIQVITIANSGVSNARNVGILSATKDFIAFLDADDIWYQDKLRIQLGFFEKYPDIAFSCCNYYHLSRSSKTKIDFFSQLKNKAELTFDRPIKGHAFPRLLETNIVGTSSNVIFKRDLIDSTGLFNTNIRQAEDFDMWLKFSRFTNFILSSQPLLEKSTHEENLTNNFLETLLCREQVIADLKNNSMMTELVYSYLKKYYIELANTRYRIAKMFYRNKSFLSTLRYFFLAAQSYFCASISSLTK